MFDKDQPVCILCFMVLEKLNEHNLVDGKLSSKLYLNWKTSLLSLESVGWRTGYKNGGYLTTTLFIADTIREDRLA